MCSEDIQYQKPETYKILANLQCNNKLLES